MLRRAFRRHSWIAARTYAVALALPVTLIACSSHGVPNEELSRAGELSPMTTAGTGTPIPPASACEITIAQAVDSPRSHVEVCSSLTFDTMPPSHGIHYSQWASFAVYDHPIPWGYVVHSLEHGAVFLGYDCSEPGGCPGLVSQLRAFYDGVPADPRCGDTSARARVILAPVSGLGAPVVASAWGWVYRATCFDAPSLQAFFDAHYGRAPEQLCASGASDPTCP